MASREEDLKLLAVSLLTMPLLFIFCLFFFSFTSLPRESWLGFAAGIVGIWMTFLYRKRKPNHPDVPDILRVIFLIVAFIGIIFGCVGLLLG